MGGAEKFIGVLQP